MTKPKVVRGKAGMDQRPDDGKPHPPKHPLDVAGKTMMQERPGGLLSMPKIIVNPAYDTGLKELEPVRTASNGVRVYTGIVATPKNNRANLYPWKEIKVGEQFFVLSRKMGVSQVNKRLAPKRFTTVSGVSNPETGKPAILVTRVK